MKNPLDKIRKLFALARDKSNKNASMLAAKRAAELMLKYNISQVQIDEAEAKVGRGVYHEHTTDDGYKYLLARAAALFYGAIPVADRSDERTSEGFRFFGREENVAACEMTYEALCYQVDTLYAGLSAGNATRESGEYKALFLQYIAMKLYSDAEDIMRKTIDNSRKLLGCNALVAKTKLENMAAEAADYVEKENNAVAIIPSEGALDGFRAAKHVTFHKEVK